MLENFPDKELDLFANAIKLGLFWESREPRKELPNCSASRIMTASYRDIFSRGAERLEKIGHYIWNPCSPFRLRCLPF